MRKRKIKVKKFDSSFKNYEAFGYEIMKGGVLAIFIEDQYGKRRTIFVSPNSWDEVEFDV